MGSHCTDLGGVVNELPNRVPTFIKCSGVCSIASSLAICPESHFPISPRVAWNGMSWFLEVRKWYRELYLDRISPNNLANDRDGDQDGGEAMER